MATKIVATTLKVVITESISLNNLAKNSNNEIDISNIGYVDLRILSIPFGSQINIIDFAAANANGTFITANLKYLRITNKDDTNFVRIRLSKASSVTADFMLQAGASFMITDTKLSATATLSTFTSFNDIDTISAQADTANVDIEYFVATV